MSKVILDAEIRLKLDGLSQPTEFCDSDGRTVGHFLPAAVYEKLLYAVAEAQRPPLSPEETERRRREPGGRSLQEIWKSLGVFHSAARSR